MGDLWVGVMGSQKDAHHWGDGGGGGEMQKPCEFRPAVGHELAGGFDFGRVLGLAKAPLKPLQPLSGRVFFGS